MPNFVNITREDMDSFLAPQGFRALSLSGVHELVYAKRVDSDGLKLSLRVYTGINPDGNSREVGSDAMRCVVFGQNSEGEAKKVATSKRVHRVAGWKKNLQDRLDSFGPFKACSCGSPMVERKGKNGNFYGCTSFPTCRNTERI